MFQPLPNKRECLYQIYLDYRIGGDYHLQLPKFRLFKYYFGIQNSVIGELFENIWISLMCVYIQTCHFEHYKYVLCIKPETESQEVAEVTLTLALAVFGAVGPTRGWDEAQLATEHVGVRYWEVVITDGSPLSLVEKLYPTFVVFSGVSRQSDL